MNRRLELAVWGVALAIAWVTIHVERLIVKAWFAVEPEWHRSVREDVSNGDPVQF